MRETDTTALLVLDVQNYFFQPGSPAYLDASRTILPNINALVTHASQARWPVVLTTHHSPSDESNLMGQKWRHLPRGEECALYDGLHAPDHAVHVPKEHYSAFFRTNLEESLSQQGITRVVVCGVMTHLCVDTTVRHAFLLGFKPVVVADACCSKTRAFHWAALTALGHGFAEIVCTDEIRVVTE